MNETPLAVFTDQILSAFKRLKSLQMFNIIVCFENLMKLKSFFIIDTTFMLYIPKESDTIQTYLYLSMDTNQWHFSVHILPQYFR
jgi:hypothetical protein